MPLSEQNSYIVRIYRREENNPFKLIGVVEESAGEGKKVFRTPEELVNILLDRKDAVCGASARPKDIPVLVKGVDCDGKPFSENATLTGLNPGGASIIMKSPVAPDSKLIIYISPVRSGPGIKARVVKVTDQSGGALKMVGISFDSGRDYHLHRCKTRQIDRHKTGKTVYGRKGA